MSVIGSGFSIEDDNTHNTLHADSPTFCVPPTNLRNMYFIHLLEKGLYTLIQITSERGESQAVRPPRFQPLSFAVIASVPRGRVSQPEQRKTLLPFNLLATSSCSLSWPARLPPRIPLPLRPSKRPPHPAETPGKIHCPRRHTRVPKLTKGCFSAVPQVA